VLWCCFPVSPVVSASRLQSAVVPGLPVVAVVVVAAVVVSPRSDL